MVILDTTYTKDLRIINFFQNNRAYKYLEKNIFFIAYLGLRNGEHLFKFGKFPCMQIGDYDKIRNKFDTFIMVYMIETDNYDHIIKLFDMDMFGYGFVTQIIY